MAKKSTVNKSQAVRDYFADHPDAMPKEVIAALGEQGIAVSRVLVSGVKSKLNKAGKAKKPARRAAKIAVVVEAPARVEKPTKPGETITLEQIKKVAATINAVGGLQRMVEVLDAIKETGGVKKFKDLAEAMACPAIDDIPY